jgi:hypothetical protein
VEGSGQEGTAFGTKSAEGGAGLAHYKEKTVNEQPSWEIQDDPKPSGPVGEMPSGSVLDEETLVADPRGEMTPAQLVERKLVTLLRTGALPVSVVYTDRYTGR